MDNYDIDILKDNIKKRMNELSITQSKLSEETGIPQPTISNVLSKKNGSNFTVIQLIEIAQYLECSIDDLVGLNTQKKQKIETLSDILELLFEIDCNIEIKTAECKTVDTVETPDGEVSEITNIGIYLDHPDIKDTLKQWNELKKSNIEKTTKNKVIELWKSDILEKYRINRKEWGFRNIGSWEIYLTKLLISANIDKFIILDKERQKIETVFLPPQLQKVENLRILINHINFLESIDFLRKDDCLSLIYTNVEIEFLILFKKWYLEGGNEEEIPDNTDTQKETPGE